jgi:hypothetical protein
MELLPAGEAHQPDEPWIRHGIPRGDVEILEDRGVFREVVPLQPAEVICRHAVVVVHADLEMEAVIAQHREQIPDALQSSREIR